MKCTKEIEEKARKLRKNGKKPKISYGPSLETKTESKADLPVEGLLGVIRSCLSSFSAQRWLDSTFTDFSLIWSDGEKNACDFSYLSFLESLLSRAE